MNGHPEEEIDHNRDSSGADTTAEPVSLIGDSGRFACLVSPPNGTLLQGSPTAVQTSLQRPLHRVQVVSCRVVAEFGSDASCSGVAPTGAGGNGANSDSTFFSPKDVSDITQETHSETFIR